MTMVWLAVSVAGWFGGLGAARGQSRPNAVAATPNMEMAETRRAGKAVAAGRDFFEEESELLGDLDAAASVASLASADELGECSNTRCRVCPCRGSVRR
jgi:hypothetical protein